MPSSSAISKATLHCTPAFTPCRIAWSWKSCQAVALKLLNPSAPTELFMKLGSCPLQDRMHLDCVFSILGDRCCLMLEEMIGEESRTARFVDEYTRDAFGEHPFCCCVQCMSLTWPWLGRANIPNKRHLKQRPGSPSSADSNLHVKCCPLLLTAATTGLSWHMPGQREASLALVGARSCGTSNRAAPCARPRLLTASLCLQGSIS